MRTWRRDAPGVLRRVARSPTAHNMLALYLVQGAAYLVPLATLPYLARTLGPGPWGLVVFGQGFAAWVILVLQYGFPLSGTRDVARARAEPGSDVAAIVAGVQGAKAILAATVVVPLGVIAVLAVPEFSANPRVLVAACLWAVVQGFHPVWYFQGMERLRGVATLDVGFRLAAAIGIFAMVRQPEDGWIVIALSAATTLASTAITSVWMYREIAFRIPSPRAAVAALREGWGLFVYTGATSLYTTANPLLLGLLSHPAAVSFYGAADKLIRAVLSLIGPVALALYPRMSQIAARDRDAARREVLRLLPPLLALGLLLGIGLWVSAPLVTRLAFGPRFETTATVLRISSLLPPLIALGTVFGTQWALPMGLDRAYLRLVLLAGVVNLVGAALLVPRFGAPGMAWAVVASEASVEIGLIWLFARSTRGGLPRWLRPTGPVPALGGEGAAR